MTLDHVIRPLSHVAYLALAAIIASAASGSLNLADVQGALIVVGIVGAWRYGWAALNFSRAFVFLKLVYPRKRRQRERAFAAQAVRPHAFFLATSYKIEPEVTARVYHALFTAAARSTGGATVVASVVDSADARLIRQLYEAMPIDHGNVRLIVDRIAGTGKRDALARALELISSQNPTRHDVVAFVDGDSCVPDNLLERALPVFTDPDVGAMTTDEEALIERDGLFRKWFNLRFAQRHAMMSSMALSERVLTLTGRMSVFRADLATQPAFIRQVRDDSIAHWRLGEIKFLTGDDKSTWYWLLSHGYKMVYVPDLVVVSMESQPLPGFFKSATTLMVRWYGNMMRTNARALDLGPRRIGMFTWWSILDQRVSIWTTLAGPTSVLIAAVFVSPLVLVLYLSWVMATRYVFCGIISAFRGRLFPISYPFLLYFGQIVGAVIKSYVSFRLDRQKWTRQKTQFRIGTGVGPRLRAMGSVGMHVLALGWLVLAVFYLSAPA